LIFVSYYQTYLCLFLDFAYYFRSYNPKNFKMFLNIKYQFILILFLAVSNYTHAQKQQTDLSKMSLLGEVQTISHIEYSLNRDRTFVQEASFLIRFNTKGYNTLIKHYNRDLRLDYKTMFEYDKKNRLITAIKYRVYEELDSSLASKDTLSYNVEEKTITLDHYTSRAVLKGKTIWKEGGIEIIGYAPDGKVMMRNIQKLNKNEQPISEERYIVNNKFMGKMTWEYFKKKVLLKNYDKNGKLTYSSIRKLDLHGNVISWNFPSLKKQNIYKYTYDKQNNWVQKIIYKKGKEYSKIERTIKYY